MSFVKEELMTQLDEYLKNKTKEELLNDLIKAGALNYIIDTTYIREYDFTYGVVTDFNCCGYGFIVSEDNNKYFVFWKNILIKGFKSLNKGEKVKFKIREGSRGLEAYDVSVLPDDFVLNFAVND